jgi:predicted ester cyclase
MKEANARKGEDMTHTSTRDELVARLVRAGELEISGESQEEADSYFDTQNFAFHGYFQSIRAAFEDRTIRRGIIVAEGDLIACQTWIEGTFTGPFTHSPVGKLEPNGARVVWDLMNMFRFDDRGRLVEEFVSTDNRSFLRQLGAEVA